MDYANALSKRTAVRDEHLSFAKTLKEENKLLLGVALLNDRSDIIGSLMIFNIETREELDSLIMKDPYNREEIWETKIVYNSFIPGFFNLERKKLNEP